MEMEMPRQGRKQEQRGPLDELAKGGFYKKGDAPGTDTFDDGLDEKGRLKPGSTSTGSGGNYMENSGPHDLRRRGGEDLEALAEQGGLRVVDTGETSELIAGGNIYEGNDEAAKWLRSNDPKYGKEGLRDAA